MDEEANRDPYPSALPSLPFLPLSASPADTSDVAGITILSFPIAPCDVFWLPRTSAIRPQRSIRRFTLLTSLNYCTYNTEPLCHSRIIRRACHHIHHKTTSGPVDLNAICRNKTKNPSSMGCRTLAHAQRLGELFFFTLANFPSGASELVKLQLSGAPSLVTTPV